jgi:hypothetical protein
MSWSVMAPGAPQEIAGEAEIELGSAAWQPGISQWTDPLSYHIPLNFHIFTELPQPPMSYHIPQLSYHIPN